LVSTPIAKRLLDIAGPLLLAGFLNLGSGVGLAPCAHAGARGHGFLPGAGKTPIPISSVAPMKRAVEK
jgi:hypothetical protein